MVTGLQGVTVRRAGTQGIGQSLRVQPAPTTEGLVSGAASALSSFSHLQKQGHRLALRKHRRAPGPASRPGRWEVLGSLLPQEYSLARTLLISPELSTELGTWLP